MRNKGQDEDLGAQQQGARGFGTYPARHAVSLRMILDVSLV